MSAVVGVVGSGALLVVEDKLYGYRGEGVGAGFEVGWLPVARVEAGVRVLERLGAYGWALGERYRIEQVFGSVKGVYGSYVGCRCC